jgi:glycosyltransferase involved in cell wall biosynthesis
MARKKILVIGTADNIGGAARVGWNIGSYAEKYGYNVKYIVAYKKSRSSNVYELKKNSFITWLVLKTGYNLVSLLRFIRAFIFADDIDFGAEDEILNHPWYKEADIVHCHNLHGNFFKLATLSKIASERSTVWTLHDGWALTAHCAHCFDCKKYNNGKHFTPGLKRYGAMLWDNSTYLWNKKKDIYQKSPKLHLVSPSLWLANRVKNSILKDKPLIVINNGIDTEIFRPRDKITIRKELRLPFGKTIIAYVAQMGTVDPRKGGSYFLKTANYFSDNSNVVFLCIGGIVGDKVVRKDNIIYIPFISDKEKLSYYYSSADVLLFTSLAENFPLVTLEALASGLPVVSFDVGGVKEQVEHKINGYIAKYKNQKDLDRGLKYILDLDKNGVQKMMARNREKAQTKYSIKKMSGNYIDLYENIIRNNK